MVLNRWNAYLTSSNNPVINLKKNSDISTIIDYFSAPNLLDTFNLGGDFNYDNYQFQFIKNNLTFLNANGIANIQLFDKPLNNSFLDYHALFNLNNPLKNLEVYINDIKLITPVNNNLENLIDFFSERVIHFENFELSSLESDGGVFEALSTPDLKILYPEPFISSPSLLHEDL